MWTVATMFRKGGLLELKKSDSETDREVKKILKKFK